MKQMLGVITAVACIVYAVVWWRAASPYLPFPSDDERNIHAITAARQGIFESIPRCISSDAAVYLATRLSGSGSPSVLLGLTIFCNCLTMALLSLWCWRMTKSMLASIVVLLLFGTAAWPTTYMFMWFYSPVSALYLVIAAWFLVRSDSNAVVGCLWLLAALLSSATSSLGVALLACALLMVRRERLPSLQLVLGLLGLALVFGATMTNPAQVWLKGFFGHVASNVHGEHYDAAVERFGAFPKAPMFCGVWMLWKYCPALCILWLCAVVSQVLMFKKYGTMTFLTFVCVAHELVLDFAPIPKVARAYYMVFPFQVLLIVVTIDEALRWSFKNLHAWHQPAIWFCIIAACWSGVLGSYETQQVRMQAPSALSGKLATLPFDPHARWIQGWLGKRFQFVEWTRAGMEAGDFSTIIGPVGRDSGISIVHHGCLVDLIGDVDAYARLFGATVHRFRYCATHRPFCLEEETMVGLLWDEKVPDQDKDKSKQLSILWK